MPDATEFETFYRGASRGIFLHLCALTGSQSDAQELMQEAFTRAWERWDRVSRYDVPQAWVRLVATRLARRRSRHAGRTRLMTVDVAEEGASPLDRMVIVEALRTVPFRQREVLVLHYVADLPVDEIAAELRQPVGTVKSRLSRGREALGAALDGGSETHTPSARRGGRR